MEHIKYGFGKKVLYSFDDTVKKLQKGFKKKDLES